MPQISEREFERVPLRVHRFLAGVPLHDVWAVDLPSPRPGITLDEFLRAANERLYSPTPVVRGLLDLRLLIGRVRVVCDDHHCCCNFALQLSQFRAEPAAQRGVECRERFIEQHQARRPDEGSR